VTKKSPGGYAEASSCARGTKLGDQTLRTKIKRTPPARMALPADALAPASGRILSAQKQQSRSGNEQTTRISSPATYTIFTA
jgi:hypothetical protein